MNQSVHITIGLWVTLLFLVSIPSAGAAEFPYPKVEFSADMQMNVQAQGSTQPYIMKGKVYSAKGKERREINSFGRLTAIIKDKQKGESWTLMPDRKMAMRNQEGGPHKDPEQKIRDGELKMTRMGTETVNGHKAVKYKIESTSRSSGQFSGHAWFDKHNIPVRFSGVSSENGVRQNIRIEYTNIVVSRQDPSLFVVPAGYRKMNSGMGAMGAPGKGMTPEQMEQMMKMIREQQKSN